MSGKVFIDTNVLIYAATGREDFPAKFHRAHEIIAHENFGLSTQVIGEFFLNVQSKKKMTNPLTYAQTTEWIDHFFLFPLIEIDRKIVESAMIVHQRYQLRYWDCVIVAAAERLGAETLYSEDMSHGQLYGTVRCENPFRIN